MPLIIDTYNVLHVVGVLPPDLAGIDVEGLTRLIETSRYGRKRAVLVCDGVRSADPSQEGAGRVFIRYAGPNRKADDLIAVMIRQSSAPRRIIVVSSDRQVLRAATRRRCRTITSEDFLRRLLADSEAPRSASKPPRAAGGPLRESQVERWARIFGLDAEAELPEDLKPSEEEFQALLGREPEPEEPAAGQMQGATKEAEADSPRVEPQETRPPRPAPRPILPGHIIREAAALLAEFEGTPTEPVDGPSERDLPERTGGDEEPDVHHRSPNQLSEELVEADAGGPVVPPEIIRQAEQLLAELEAGPLRPPEEKEEA